MKYKKENNVVTIVPEIGDIVLVKNHKTTPGFVTYIGSHFNPDEMGVGLSYQINDLAYNILVSVIIKNTEDNSYNQSLMEFFELQCNRTEWQWRSQDIALAQLLHPGCEIK